MTVDEATQEKIKNLFKPNSLVEISSEEEDRGKFVTELKKLVQNGGDGVTSDMLIGPLQDMLPPPGNSVKLQDSGALSKATEPAYLPLYVEAIKLVADKEENKAQQYLSFIKRFLVNRKFCTEASVENCSTVSDLVSQFTKILAVEVPERVEEDESTMLDEGPESEASVYIRMEHFKAILALVVIAMAWPSSSADEAPLVDVCGAVFDRMKKCHPWRLDNENNDWEKWEYSWCAFDLLKRLVPQIALEAHKNLVKAAPGGDDTKNDTTPIQQLLDWAIHVADKSYYENRSQLVYSFYGTYEAAAKAAPMTTFRAVDQWMADSFNEDGWEWSHKTEAMCHLALHAIQNLPQEQIKGDEAPLRTKLETMYLGLVDPETGELHEECEENCEEPEPIEALYQLLTELMSKKKARVDGEDGDDDAAAE